MIKFKVLILLTTLFFYAFFQKASYSESHNFDEIIKILQQDLKTLEKAVYSSSENENLNENVTQMDQSSEEVLTRHLLKLSEIEKQFQELTNKFEEINFKLDKLSSRLSKVQADNQMRFQELETLPSGTQSKNKISSISNDNETLPGSSEPQDLGAISYKDNESKYEEQQIQSVDTTGSVVTETFVSEEKILPETNPSKQYEFATSFLKNGDYNLSLIHI